MISSNRSVYLPSFQDKPFISIIQAISRSLKSRIRQDQLKLVAQVCLQSFSPTEASERKRIEEFKWGFQVGGPKLELESWKVGEEDWKSNAGCQN